jgi:8-oxo-dGTP pyrophosphatase MutT (NUDIX family)
MSCSSPLESLHSVLDVATIKQRDAVGVAILTSSSGKYHILLVRQAYPYALKDIGYHLRAYREISESEYSKLEKKPTRSELTEKIRSIISELTVEELSKLSDVALMNKAIFSDLLRTLRVHFAPLSNEDYSKVTDLGQFSTMITGIYYDSPQKRTQVLAAYKLVHPFFDRIKGSGKDFEDRWSLPKGGASKAGETRYEALSRELSEETGLRVNGFAILPIAPFTYDISVDNYLFRTHVYFAELNRSIVFPMHGETIAPALKAIMPAPKNPLEIEKVEFVPLNVAKARLPAETWEGLRKAMSRYANNRSAELQKFSE